MPQFIIMIIIFFAVYSSIKKSIRKSNGIMGNKVKCPKCNRMVNASAYNCSHCGTSIKRKCKNCGQWVYVGMEFCPACHKPMNSNQTVQTTYSQNTAYTAQTNKSFNNAAKTNNNVKCTYHDTYSAGYDPNCEINNYYRPHKINYDDIGFVKGKGRTKVETVDDYMRERHKEGAYHVNTNQVQSYNREGSYADYTDNPKQKSRKKSTAVGSSKAKSSCLAVIIIIAVIVIFSIVSFINIAGDFFENFSSYSSDNTDLNNNHYAYNIIENASYDDIAGNYIDAEYFNEIKSLDVAKEDLIYVDVHYDDYYDIYQFMIYRVTANPKAARVFLYYDKQEDTFNVEQYVISDNPNIANTYILPDGTVNYIQVTYQEYEVMDDEEFINNLKCKFDDEYIGVSYSIIDYDIMPIAVDDNAEESEA